MLYGQSLMNARDPNRRERGAALIVALIALTALLGIGGVTMLSVQSETRSTGEDRFQGVSLYAAESGVAVGLEFLRTTCSVPNHFTAYVSPSNGAPVVPAGILGNGVQPGQAGNPLTPSNQSWYQVQILNNDTDPGFAAGADTDWDVILYVVGHGPDQTQSIIEVEVSEPNCTPPVAVASWKQLF